MKSKPHSLTKNLTHIFKPSYTLHGKIVDLGRKVGIRHRLERCRVYAEEYIAHYYIHFKDNQETLLVFHLSEKLFDQLSCGDVGTLVVKGDKAIAFTIKRTSEVQMK